MLTTLPLVDAVSDDAQSKYGRNSFMSLMC